MKRAFYNDTKCDTADNYSRWTKWNRCVCVGCSTKMCSKATARNPPINLYSPEMHTAWYKFKWKNRNKLWPKEKKKMWKSKIHHRKWNEHAQTFRLHKFSLSIFFWLLAFVKNALTKEMYTIKSHHKRNNKCVYLLFALSSFSVGMSWCYFFFGCVF